MRNTSSKKNPYASGLPGSAGHSANRQASAAAKQQVASVQAETTRQLLDLWRGKAAPGEPQNKKTR